MFDVFYMSQSKYGELASNDVALELLNNWLLPRARESKNYVSVRKNLMEAFYNVRGNDAIAVGIPLTTGPREPQYQLQNVIYKIWSSYNDLLSHYGLKELPRSTWQNNTGRKLTTWDDFNEFRTFLLGTTCWQHFRGDPANDTGTSPSGVIPKASTT